MLLTARILSLRPRLLPAPAPTRAPLAPLLFLFQKLHPMTHQLLLQLRLQHPPNSRSGVLCPALLAPDPVASQALVACLASPLARLLVPVLALTATEAASLKVNPTESLWKTSLWMTSF